jgi:hypothetical protein
MGSRLDDLLQVLKVIRQIVDEHQDAIDIAITDGASDREIVDALQFAATIPREYHVVCQLLISERETLGQALEAIRQALDKVDIEPRTTA